ncbi:YaaR family protein [[Brevibacterium] frigoritolerans]|nr:YaaR family protein [Peribacillus frigoritolerans]
MDIRPPNEMLLGRIERFVETKPSNTSDIKEKADKFEETMKSIELEGVERTETLEQWIDSLEEIKSKLEQDITKDNLNLYKDSVKKFLDYYVKNDLYLKEYKTRDGLFYSKNVQVLKSVDDKIDELTDKLVSSQMGRLEILKLTGQIQGLLFELTV